MNFVEELRWRGMLHDMTPGAEEKLAEGMACGYIGFDPTAPSLTIGNYVQIMLLSFWQKSGNKPYVLMGGATGRIGDPSGKDKERELKSFEELDSNLQFQKDQIKQFLNFEDGPNKAEFVNNIDFYQSMNVLDFLRDVGKTLTVNYMMSKDSVKNRLDTGLSFTEFSYQLLQAYDFQCLYEKENCQFQMGGSDQWGNITSGSEFIRRNTQGKAYAITTPLLTKSDGSKFGKSAEGNVWLDSRLTSPYAFYQFWLNADDADLEKYFKYFSYKNKEEQTALFAEFGENPQHLKRLFAAEITERIHGKEELEQVQAVTEILFNKKASQEQLLSLSSKSFDLIHGAISAFDLPMSLIEAQTGLLDIMAESTNICQSKSEARKAIKNNAVSLNKIKVQSEDTKINKTHLIHDKYIMLENGKKNKYLLQFV